LVAPVRFVPRIVTGDPTSPEVVCVSTNGPRPTDRLKIVRGSHIIGTKTYANALGLSTADFREAPFPVLMLDRFYRSSRSAL
jgi:hypothetical protein